MEAEPRYWKLPGQLVEELEELSTAGASAPKMSRELEEWILRYPHPMVWSGVAGALTASQEFLERLYWLSDDGVTRENVGMNPTAPLHIIAGLPLHMVHDLNAFAERLGRPDLAGELWRRAEASDDTQLREVWLALGGSDPGALIPPRWASTLNDHPYDEEDHPRIPESSVHEARMLLRQWRATKP